MHVTNGILTTTLQIRYGVSSNLCFFVCELTTGKMAQDLTQTNIRLKQANAFLSHERKMCTLLSVVISLSD
jgi:hypothetical protein